MATHAFDYDDCLLRPQLMLRESPAIHSVGVLVAIDVAVCLKFRITWLRLLDDVRDRR